MGEVRKEDEVFVPTVLFAQASGKVNDEVNEEMKEPDKENLMKLLKEVKNAE